MHAVGEYASQINVDALQRTYILCSDESLLHNFRKTN